VLEHVLANAVAVPLAAGEHGQDERVGGAEWEKCLWQDRRHGVGSTIGYLTIV
jgi:hypothetical protein